MPEQKQPNTIDEYISTRPEAIQPKLQDLRQIIANSSPLLTEKMSWRMPTFYYLGNIIHFAAQKKHIGLYPGAEAILKFTDRLTEYKTSKGAIQIPNTRDLDRELITDMVQYNLMLREGGKR